MFKTCQYATNDDKVYLDLTLLRHGGKGASSGKGHELTME
jgi:hypothetical protein